MKKIIFPIVGSMLISLCAVQAQERDTTGMASKSRNKQNKQRYEQSQQRDQRGQQQQQTWQQQDDSRNAYANEGMVIIEKEEIPSSLKQTLKKEKYAGWENATIYHNTNTGEYVIAPRAYRFDEQGKEIEMGNTGYGSRDGNQNRYGDKSNGQNMQEPQERTAQSQQGQDQRGESSTYSSRDQSDRNNEYKSNKSETKRNQTSKTQPQSYDQAQRNQQPSDDESSTNDQSQNQQETADQSSESQQSNTYTRDQQNQRNGQQQPSTGYRSGQTDQSNDNGQNQPGQSSQNYRTEDMTEVQPEQIPATLRRTLSERQYSGWEENGKLYKDPATNEYVLVMEKQDDSSQPKAYRFDKNGQLKDDQTSSGDQNKSGSQNGASQRNNGQ